MKVPVSSIMDGSAMSARNVIADHLSPIGDPAQKGRYLYHADAILSALRSAGFAVVPVEPTEVMCIAGGEAQQRCIGSWGEPRIVYRAMIVAAQEDSK